MVETLDSSPAVAPELPPVKSNEELIKERLAENAAESNKQEVERDQSDRFANYQEILRSGPKNIEELVHLVNSAGERELLNSGLTKKYGEGRIGKLKAFLAGDLDVGLGADRENRWNWWNEITRKGLATFANRRVFASAATTAGITAVLGVLTGGVAIPAAAGGVIFGSIAGRGAAETISIFRGKERQARLEILKAEREKLAKLKELSAELYKTDDLQKKSEIMTQITDIYYSQGQSVVIQKLKFANESLGDAKQSENKLRARLQTVGELAGLAGGVAHGFLTGKFAAIDIDLWNKVDGQTIVHGVQMVDGQWHFAYTAAEKATGMGSTMATHLLGEPAWKIGAAAAAEHGLPVLLAAWGAHFFGRNGRDKEQEKQETYYNKKQAVEKQQVNESIPKPKMPEPPATPTPPSPVKTAEKATETAVISPGDQHKKEAEDLIGKLKRGQLPDKDQSWKLIVSDKKLQGAAVIENVDWNNNRVHFWLERDYESGKDEALENMPIPDFLKNYARVRGQKDKRPEPSSPTPSEAAEPAGEKPKRVEKGQTWHIDGEKRNVAAVFRKKEDDNKLYTILELIGDKSDRKEILVSELKNKGKLITEAKKE